MSKLLLIFLLTSICQRYSYAAIGFRWGGEIDDTKLANLSKKINDSEFRLTNDVILDVVNFMDSKGWSNRPSGAGIYYSTDLTDSFSDDRKELFIFNISDSIPISNGNLGLQVRNYYLNSGVAPPYISKYTPTWYVIARPPSDAEFEKGLKILFHRATANDASTAFVNTHGKAKQHLEKFFNRLNDVQYGASIPAETRAFMSAYAEMAVTSSDETLWKSAKRVIEKTNSLNCNGLMSPLNP